MDLEQVHAKAEEDLKEAEEFFSPANLNAIAYLRSALGLPQAPNCGHHVKRTPTLDELDKWR
jgi:hypothetical protein